MAAVAEVMPERDQNSRGRRRVVHAARPGLAVFGAREKRCACTTYGRDSEALRPSRGSNCRRAPHILDWHVAAIIFPHRSRGPAD